MVNYSLIIAHSLFLLKLKLLLILNISKAKSSFDFLANKYSLL